jgi:hypothetical protein
MSDIQPQPAAASNKKPLIPPRTVKMDDGRTVEFPGSRRLQKEAIIKDGKVAVRFDFENGETRILNLRDELLHKAAAHGLSQKGGDEMSGIKDLDDAIVAFDGLAERLNKGEWNETAATGEGMAGASILLQALVRVSGKPKEVVRSWLNTLSPKQKAAMREDSTLKPTILELEAEKAAKAKKQPEAAKIDTAALMGSFLGGSTTAAQNSVFPTGDGVPPVTAGNEPQAEPSADPTPVALESVSKGDKSKFSKGAARV